MKNNFLNNDKGFSLMEILVSVLIVSSLTVSIFSLVIQSIKITANNKYTLAANTLVNKKLEFIRSLPYDNVAIVGFGNGILESSENVPTNSGNFILTTQVTYIDDPFDGLWPVDTIPNDYKKVLVRATWNGPFGESNLGAHTNIVPRGMEAALSGGTLAISVHNASGGAVENAVVNIINNDLIPNINSLDNTNSFGAINYFGAPESIEGYQISVTKPGYSIDATYPRTATNTNPTMPHATVLDLLRTEISFAIDLLSDLEINTVTANLPKNFIVSSDTTGKDQTTSRLVIDNSGNIYIVWRDFRQTTRGKIYAQKYNSDGDALWGDDEVVGTPDNQVLPDIDIDSAGNLYVVWSDDSNGNKDAYIVRLDSSNGNNTWGGTKKMDVLENNKDQMSPRLKVSEHNGNTFINVVFEDDRNLLDIFAIRYDFDGNMIWSNEIKANTNPSGDGTKQYSPHLAVNSQEELFIVWTDERNGVLDVYGQKYASSGIAIWPQDLIIPTQATSSDQFSPSTAIGIDSLDNIYVVWSDNRNGNFDIYAQKYDTYGDPLWTNDLKMNNDSGNAHQFQPAIAIDNSNNIFLVWTDERNGDQDIYGQRYNSDGIPSWPADMRINMDLEATNQYNPDITIHPVTNEPYVTWESDDNGVRNIYASSFGDYSSETPIQGVEILVRGEKRIGENPIIYKYENNHISNTSGIINLYNIEWDSYSFSINPSSGYQIIITDPTMPIALDPDTSESIKIYLAN